MGKDPREPARARGMLVLCDGEFAGAEYRLVAEETLIGRNPTTDVTLLDESVSREHAIVAYDAATGSYAIEDLQSTNGTRVNGKRVRSATLSDGDEVRVGHTRFRFLLVDGGKAAQAPGGAGAPVELGPQRGEAE